MTQAGIKKAIYWSIIILVFIGVTSILFNRIWPSLKGLRRSIALGTGLIMFIGWPTAIGFLSYYLYERLIPKSEKE